MIEAKPENLIGDRAYDSDPLDEELRRDIEMIAPHHANRSKPPTQDRRNLAAPRKRDLTVPRYGRPETANKCFILYAFFVPPNGLFPL